VFVEHYDQSSPYIKRMWRHALRRLPQTLSVSRTLLLGLGGGSIIDDLAHRFPASKLTVVEHDPVMVEVAQSLKLFSSTPEVVIEDAVRAVPNLPATYNLIIVDLYRGGETAGILSSEAFVKSIEQKLAPDGFLLLNVFKNTSLFPLFDEHFSYEDHWVFSYNNLALYKKRPAGQGPTGR
jgi:spermidine synthase